MPLDARSQRDTAAMLAKLALAEQARLIAAMSTIERLLGHGSAAELAPQRSYVLRSPRPGDFGWIVKRHAELYAQEYRWVEPFEGLCAQIVADFVNKYDPSRDRCWIGRAESWKSRGNSPSIRSVGSPRSSPCSARPRRPSPWSMPCPRTGKP